MKRTATGLCVAVAFGCIATLGAQTPPPAGQQTATSDKAREVTITGCLTKAPDGKFTLANAQVDKPMSGSTTGTSGTATATPPAGAMNQTPAMTFALAGGTDLDKHVGHKVQVTGKTAWDSMDRGKTPGATSAAGTAGTSGTTSTAATEAQRKDPNADQPRVDVQSVKMIAASCS
jgi:hypothetical protein